MNEYWVIDVGTNQFAISEERMPPLLLPNTREVIILEPNRLLWLTDMDDSPVGIRLGALMGIWWSTPAIRESNRALAKESEGPPWD